MRSFLSYGSQVKHKNQKKHTMQPIGDITYIEIYLNRSIMYSQSILPPLMSAEQVFQESI